MTGGVLVGMSGAIFGTRDGAEIALQHVICSVWMFLIGLLGLRVRALTRHEKFN